ncbi:hypothetical protein CXR34_08715 [Microbacterium hominis]|uniref:Uncharacterized protein n=1 Tax=Microbacterium hominis TaxID=162426 RepID=A0A2K9D7E7_9MICO|nr:hypothetical protein CXR34_08715 [Microbacterium hominis]
MLGATGVGVGVGVGLGPYVAMGVGVGTDGSPLPALGATYRSVTTVDSIQPDSLVADATRTRP